MGRQNTVMLSAGVLQRQSSSGDCMCVMHLITVIVFQVQALKLSPKKK